MDDLMTNFMNTPEEEFTKEEEALFSSPSREIPAGIPEAENPKTNEDISAEATDKFRSQTSQRMKAIGQQLFYMRKIPDKRGIDYTKEDVEKIFSYLREEIDKCENEFMKKFEEKKSDKFDFDFKF